MKWCIKCGKQIEDSQSNKESGKLARRLVPQQSGEERQ